LIPSPEDDFSSIIELLKDNQRILDVENPITRNPAKRLAGQFFNRWVTIISSETMLPAAKWWKTQINLNAKAWAQVDRISDTWTNTANGILNPEDLLSQMMAVFINSPCDTTWEKHNLDTARRLFMVEGINTDFYLAFGNSLLENIWTTIQFGDYVSYYLAMAYGVDPTPVPGIDEINPIMD
jgi:glucose/mannose-6-phosphate isomerase